MRKVGPILPPPRPKKKSFFPLFSPPCEVGPHLHPPTKHLWPSQWLQCAEERIMIHVHAHAHAYVMCVISVVRWKCPPNQTSRATIATRSS